LETAVAIVTSGISFCCALAGATSAIKKSSAAKVTEIG
jgi:hypothetical protein